ncbi:MAG: hypothetical protein H6622_13440 [Halobacteriovoraceae bacterium]|nr:hypothetical protein [Halobacteriovoraceae bacterium]
MNIVFYHVCYNILQWNDHERISLELIRTNITIIEFIVAYYDLEVSSLEEFHDIIKEQPISCMKGQNKEDADNDLKPLTSPV